MGLFTKEKPLTVEAMLEACKSTGAGSMKVIFRDAGQQPIAAVVVINGREECGDLLPLIEEAEDRWEDASRARGGEGRDG